jgi:hypothetical protein
MNSLKPRRDSASQWTRKGRLFALAATALALPMPLAAGCRHGTDTAPKIMPSSVRNRRARAIYSAPVGGAAQPGGGG